MGEVSVKIEYTLVIGAKLCGREGRVVYWKKGFNLMITENKIFEKLGLLLLQEGPLLQKVAVIWQRIWNIIHYVELPTS